jgi:hypothetical protein
VGLGDGGGDRLDRAVIAQLRYPLAEQRRHVASGRAADENGFPRQAGKPIPADGIHNVRVRQGLRPMLGHSRLQGSPSDPGRVDCVPIPFSHEGPPQGQFDAKW